MLKRLFILVGMCVFSVNVYSQDSKLPFMFIYTLQGEGVYYLDSVQIDGKTIYTDSAIVSKRYSDKDSSNGYNVKYNNIDLSNNPLFNSVFYKNEIIDMLMLCCISINKQEKTKNRYYIFSQEGKYILYRNMQNAEENLYAKYYPTNDKKNGSVSFSSKQYEKLVDYLQKEFNKGNIISLGKNNKSRGKLVVKSFSKDDYSKNSDKSPSKETNNNDCYTELIKIDSFITSDYEEAKAWMHEKMHAGYKIHIKMNKQKEYVVTALIKE